MDERYYLLKARVHVHIVLTLHPLLDIGVKVKEGSVAVQKYVINKSLTKAPHEYPDKKSQPHVQVQSDLPVKTYPPSIPVNRRRTV